MHPDPSLDFQLSRWAAYGGARWLSDVRPLLHALRDYAGWRDTFVALGERAAAEQRTLDAALHFRAAEFFMTPDDPRKATLRQRLLPMLRAASGVPASARHEVAFGQLRLPAWHLPADDARGVVVVFGGFDSYVEEFFPILTRLRSQRWTVVAFEGPGQGSVLEDQRAPMTRDWHLPLGAVLDAFGLDDVTLVGISLGGCLAIRAAAFEPRVRRVVAFDVLDDFGACMAAQMDRPVRALLRLALAVGADALVDRAAAAVARRRAVAEWGLAQAMHVFGCTSPSAALRAAATYHTRDVSLLVRQDVLLLAGAGDHYVPLRQLWRQARRLTGARSLTARVFTAAEHGQAHCQVSNLPLALTVISSWADALDAR
jgi:pimeloyl-ACP methyl ester carboxylesterase